MASGSTRVDGASPCSSDLVASLQTAFSAILLVASSGTCGIGLDARGRREPLSSDLVALRQTAFSVILLVASPGSRGSGLDARGRRGRVFLSLRSKPPSLQFSWLPRQAPVASGSMRVDGAVEFSCRFAPTAFSAILLVASSGSCCIRLDARGRPSPCRAILPLRCTENKRDSGRRQKLKPLMIVHANCWWILFLLSHEFRVKQFI